MSEKSDWKFKALVWLIAIAIGVIASILDGCATAPANKIVVQPDTVYMGSTGWAISYSPNMPKNPSASGTGWSFTFPSQDGVHYVMVPYTAKQSHKTLSITYRISGTGNLVSVDPSHGLPPNFRPMLERQGDNMVSEYYRWWSTPDHADLFLDGQIHTLSVPLTYDRWSDVYGKTNATEFNASIKNLMAVGITFGGGSSYGHGAFVTDGAAKFELVSFDIR